MRSSRDDTWDGTVDTFDHSGRTEGEGAMPSTWAQNLPDLIIADWILQTVPGFKERQWPHHSTT